jgi:hypothetical protein
VFRLDVRGVAYISRLALNTLLFLSIGVMMIMQFAGWSLVIAGSQLSLLSPVSGPGIQHALRLSRIGRRMR